MTDWAEDPPGYFSFTLPSVQSLHYVGGEGVTARSRIWLASLALGCDGGVACGRLCAVPTATPTKSPATSPTEAEAPSKAPTPLRPSSAGWGAGGRGIIECINRGIPLVSLTLQHHKHPTQHTSAGAVAPPWFVGWWGMGSVLCLKYSNLVVA